jgi:uncharacterized membrane protein
VSLAPLTDASLAIQAHAYAAVAAFMLGVVQLARLKGTASHRVLGYTWVALMLVVAISSFWIHQIRVWGPWSPIHLLSITSLIFLPYGVVMARRGAMRAHKKTMVGLFAGALVVAGFFTFMPGRIMHQVLFGG